MKTKPVAWLLLLVSFCVLTACGATPAPETTASATETAEALPMPTKLMTDEELRDLFENNKALMKRIADRLYAKEYELYSLDLGADLEVRAYTDNGFEHLYPVQPDPVLKKDFEDFLTLVDMGYDPSICVRLYNGYRVVDLTLHYSCPEGFCWHGLRYSPNYSFHEKSHIEGDWYIYQEWGV